MDEREHPPIWEVFLEAAKPMYYAFLAVSPFMLSDRTWGPIVAILYGTALIWMFILWLNRRDDPRYAKRPPDPP